MSAIMKYSILYTLTDLFLFGQINVEIKIYCECTITADTIYIDMACKTAFVIAKCIAIEERVIYPVPVDSMCVFVFYSLSLTELCRCAGISSRGGIHTFASCTLVYCADFMCTF